MRLRTKIVIALLSAATLPLLATMAISIMHSTKHVQELTLESAQNGLNAGAAELSAYFAARIAEISTCANSPLLKTMSWKDVEPFLVKELQRHDGIYEKMVLGLPGDAHVYVTNAGNPGRGGLATFDDDDPFSLPKSIEKRDYWRAAVENNSRAEHVSYVSDPMISYTSGIRQIMVASSVISDDGRVLGVLGGALPWREIDARVKQIGDQISAGSARNSKFCLVSKRGVYMYHWRPDKIIQLKRDQNNDFILNDVGEKVAVGCKITDEHNHDLAEAGRRMIAGLSGASYYIDDDTGQEMVIVYAPVPSADYALGMVMPKDAVLSSVADLKRYLAGITLISIFLVIAVSLILAQRIAEPIAALSAAANELAGGHNYAELAPTGYGEVVDLTHAFNRMTDSLSTREEELRQNEQTLKTILDSIQIGVFVVDVDDRIIADANPAALRMLGADEEEIIGQPCGEHICSRCDGHCPVLDDDQCITSKEVDLQTAAGDVIPVLKTITAAVLNGRRCLLESVVDIRNIKRVEKELLQRMNEETDAKRRLQILVADASDREKRMVELKQEVNELLIEAGKSLKYQAPAKAAEISDAFSAWRR